MMPALGEQHRAAIAATNPFEEVKPHVNEYTAQEIATLQSRLEKQLGPEYISSRPGAAGQKVHYIAAEKCINLANEVFGFNGWSSGIQNVQIDFCDENQTTGKISLGLSVIVRVTLKDGTYHEDVGYGHIENCKGKAAAFEKAKKEGTTDALKRALRNFGNILGNCVYDKDYLAKVTKLKIVPSKWDAENLHRHPDYAPIKQEGHVQAEETKAGASGGEPDDDFGSDGFDDADFGVPHSEHPDEVSLDATRTAESFEKRRSLLGNNHKPMDMNPGDPTARPVKSSTALPRPNSPAQASNPQIRHSDHAIKIDQPPRITGHPGQKQNVERLAPSYPQKNPPENQQVAQSMPSSGNGAAYTYNDSPVSQQSPRKTFNGDAPSKSWGTTWQSDSCGMTGVEPPMGFYTAKAAESLQKATISPANALPFNPHLESPSIRKTAGVDHTKTKPVVKDAVWSPAPPAPPQMTNAAPISRANIVNPQADQARRIGMPGGAASPMSNRTSYKPPQMKRPAEGSALSGPRPALGDVTTTSVNVPTDGGDNKRQRMGEHPSVGRQAGVAMGQG